MSKDQISVNQELVSQFISQQDQRKEQKPKTKRSGKAKEQRKTKQYEKMYWLSVIRYFNEHPLRKLTWKNWKYDNYFRSMELYFKGQRNKKQIKSLDQRLNKHYFQKKQLDIYDAVPVALGEFNLNEEQKQSLQAFIQKKKNGQVQKDYQEINVQLMKELQQSEKQLQEMRKIYNEFFSLSKQTKIEESIFYI